MLAERCEEILNIQATGLAKRLSHTGLKKTVVGISGGLDSTLALLVCVKAMRLLDLPLENIIGITSQAFDILTHEASEQEQENADINIRICSKNITLLDFSKSIFLAKKGYNLVNNNIEYIKEKIGI